MYTWAVRLHANSHVWHHFALETTLAVFLLILLIAQPASAAMRLQERSLYINDNQAGATTYYEMAWRYMSPDTVGSVELLFCENPIPYTPCQIPPGFDASGASLTNQSGATGFTIRERSTNRIVITRPPTSPAGQLSSYRFDNIDNPTNTDAAYSVRLKTHSSIDASGPQVDFGSIRAQVIRGIEIATQVPPMLIFCLAQQVSDNCVDTNEIYYSDMGELRPDRTLSAQSQMAVGTNASGGFAIVASGAPLSAGTNVINSLSSPTASRPGTNQFGLNLVANTAPAVGLNPEGEWANALASPDYSQPDRYTFRSGDTIAYSPNVSLMKKFTVSYIVNSSPNLEAGVYSTTINFVASGRF